MSKRRRLPTPSTSTESSGGYGFEREAAPTQAVKVTENTSGSEAEKLFTRGDGEMALCSCFSHIPMNRDLVVEAWLENRPWHIREVKRRRCNDDSKGCAFVLLRAIFERVVELERKLLKQLLTSLSKTVLPQLCRRTFDGEHNGQEGFEKMLKLLAACSEPLESRAHIASVLAKRLRQCLDALVEVAETGDADLAAELRSWLTKLDSADVMSRESIGAQRWLLQRMVTETWEARCRREAAEFAFLG